ncbi:MAG: hypothetical protein OEY01_14455 [Desulfobulbaceae bacterium]|nr:hypothetical protein [Desulfobulbaceae bacterium]
MKSTLKLFQLLLAVSGFYAALKFVGNLQYGVALLSLVSIWGVDKFEVIIDKKQKKAVTEKKAAEQAAASREKANKQVAHALRNKNVIMLTDTIEGLLWDLGFSVSSSIKYRLLDRIIEGEGLRGKLGLKIIGDVDGSIAELTQLAISCEEAGAAQDKLRILLIANNSGGLSPENGQEYKNFPGQVRNLLSQEKIIGITTQTLHELYRMCKDMNQDPNKLFSRIYQHPGGVFRL